MTPTIQGRLNAVDQAVNLGLAGQAGAAVQVRGTWTGTLVFECSLDGINFQSILGVPANTSAGVTTATANGLWQFGVAGVRVLRVRASAWTSGEAAVEVLSTQSAPGAAQGGAAAVTISDGSDASLGSTTDAKVTGDNDGTVQAKLRGLNTILASVWDSVNNWLKVSIQNTSLTVSSKTALTASSPTAATVGTSSAQAVASNSNRKGLVLINTSANRISLGLGAAAVLDSGITLNAAGGTWVMDEFNFTTAAINAIASAAGSNLTIQEFTT